MASNPDGPKQLETLLAAAAELKKRALQGSEYEEAPEDPDKRTPNKVAPCKVEQRTPGPPKRKACKTEHRSPAAPGSDYAASAVSSSHSNQGTPSSKRGRSHTPSGSCKRRRRGKKPPTPEKPKAPTPEKTKAPTPEEAKAPTPAETSEAPTEKAKAPTPEKAKTPTPEKAKAPTPEKAKTPTPEKAKAPTPEKAKAPTPEKAKTPTPEKAKAPTPEKAKAPTPEKAKAPTPEKAQQASKSTPSTPCSVGKRSRSSPKKGSPFTAAEARPLSYYYILFQVLFPWAYYYTRINIINYNYNCMIISSSSCRMKSAAAAASRPVR